MKKIGIMQPYFLPYIGYFQLINYVDEFIVYDNIQYSKKGWIQRNRILQDGREEYFTISLKKDSDYLDINQRYLAENFKIDKVKILNKIKNTYQEAPEFETIFPIIKNIFNFNSIALFDFLINSINEITYLLQINTPLLVSSKIDINHQLKSQEKVISLVKARESEIYVNPIGGKLLYSKEDFYKENINLTFIKTQHFEYNQFENVFVPNLSILDVLMFNNIEKVKALLNSFTIE